MFLHVIVLFLLLRLPPKTKLTDTLLPFTTLFRSSEASLSGIEARPIAGAAAAQVTAKPATYETVGRIEKIEGNKITLSHQPVPALNWPAMTMTFHLANPATARGFKTGDRVRFTFGQPPPGPTVRSEERRVGKEWGSRCRF